MAAPQLVLDTFATDLMPEPVAYAALVPDAKPDRLPLVYFLHGGNGSRDFLGDTRGLFDRAWADGTLPPCVAVTVSAGRSFYMDYRDGAERWETLLSGPFLDHVRQRFGTSTDRRDNAVVGISMGGMGGLRLVFKHPDVFGTVAALEPGIEPVLAYGDIELQDRFWRDDALFQKIYGSPVDADYWADNNPATIATRAPERLADVAIYLECGDQDSFGLHRGTEFLHRVLFDAGVSHEYRLMKGADHLGRTLPERFAYALRFVAGALDPLPPDDSLGPLHTMIGALRARAGL